MVEAGRTVHLVDDDESIRRSVSFMLRTTGYVVKTYATGIEFLTEVKSIVPGCVLLDVQMPQIDGLEVQRRLRAEGIFYPVIVMTGHGDVTVSVQAMKAGAVDFIEKPFEKDALLDSLNEAYRRLSRKEATDDRMRDAAVRLQALTPRERDVLDGLSQGLPNKTIAYDLGISPRTVEIHRANLMTKLDVRSLSEALRIAFAAKGE